MSIWKLYVFLLFLTQQVLSIKKQSINFAETKNMTLQEFSHTFNTDFLPDTEAIVWEPDAGTIQMHTEVNVNVKMLVFVSQGSMRIQMDGQEYLISANCFADIGADLTPMRFLSASDNIKGFVFAFTSSFINKVFNNHPPFDASYVEYVRRHPVAVLSEKMSETVNNVFNSLRYSFLDKGNIFQNNLIELKTNILLMEVANFMVLHSIIKKKADQTSDRRLSIFNNFVGLLTEHAKEEHAVEYYADALCITPQYLRRIVRYISGHSASEMVNEAVMAEVKTLMSDQSLSLQDIVREAHFSDHAVFSKFFKRMTGDTPLAYRNKL